MLCSGGAVLCSGGAVLCSGGAVADARVCRDGDGRIMRCPAVVGVTVNRNYEKKLDYTVLHVKKFRDDRSVF